METTVSAHSAKRATKIVVTRALELAKKAVEIDDEEAYGHIAMSICYNWSRRLEESEHEARRAVELVWWGQVKKSRN